MGWLWVSVAHPGRLGNMREIGASSIGVFAVLHLLAFVLNGFKSRHRLEIENLYLRHQQYRDAKGSAEHYAVRDDDEVAAYADSVRNLGRRPATLTASMQESSFPI
jgi:hypothetical protein